MRNALSLFLAFLFLFSLPSSNAQTDSVRMFIFGHSLLDHRPPLIPTPSDETTVPHWLHLLSQDVGAHYSATGQYGFLPQHANLPPFSQWGYDIVPPVWDSDLTSFASVDFNKILITAGNFIQWQGPTEPYYGGNGETPVSSTLDIMNWLEQQESGIDIYIYENWPDMAQYIAGELFPPTPAEFANYNAYTLGDFHDWWIDYQDILLAARPDINVRMIPVGPILANLLGNAPLSSIPILDLYEDNAPHGRATTYFLASLITQMAITNQVAPTTYDVPDIVHPLVEANYAAIVNNIWVALNNFNDDSGNSRVFVQSVAVPVSLKDFALQQKGANEIELRWSTESEWNNDRFEIEYAVDGIDFQKIGTLAAKTSEAESFEYSFSHLDVRANDNYYRLKQIDQDGQFEYSKILYQKIASPKNHFSISPNPSSSKQVQLLTETLSDQEVIIKVYDLTGRLLDEIIKTPINGQNNFDLKLNLPTKGLFLITAQQGSYFFNDLLILE